MDLLRRLKVRLGIKDDTENELLEVLIEDASNTITSILYKAYPTIPNDVDLTRYQSQIIAVAIEMYNKQGAEGQIQHSENGINRSWNNADFSLQALKGVSPLAYVPSMVVINATNG